MSTQSMTNKQESTPSALWAMAPGEAFRLSVGPGERDLHVAQGRLWLTREGSAQSPAEDIWLDAGETLSLATGSEWVVEGWGDTRFQLLVPPRACARNAHRASAPSAWRRVSSSLVPALG
jgi:hypothetical protein